jgi:hypothetical protein
VRYDIYIYIYIYDIRRQRVLSFHTPQRINPLQFEALEVFICTPVIPKHLNFE